MCSRTVPQWWDLGNGGPTSTEQLVKLTLDNGRWRQREMIDTCSTWRWMTIQLRQLAARSSTAISVLMLISFIRWCLLHHGLRTRVPLYRIPLTANHRRLHLQWAHEQRARQFHWHQVVLSDESRFNLWDHDGRVHVTHYAYQRCLPECLHSDIVAKHSEPVVERPELHSGVRFYIKNDTIRYELRVR